MALKHVDNFTRKSPSMQLSNGSSLLTQETCCRFGPSLCNTSTQLSGESCLLQEPRLRSRLSWSTSPSNVEKGDLK